jgi:16S rRNA (uracil1498-N3)-methyltransferase
VNLVLLHPEDFFAPGQARLSHRRFEHVRNVHRAVLGTELNVGLLGDKMGKGRVIRMDESSLDLEVFLDQAPPPKLPLTLVLALPRPKVLNRVLASATSLGIGHIVLLNAWRVEKSYWKSPRMVETNLREQMILGLEQAKDTTLPKLELARFFRSFAEEALPGISHESRKLVAHPNASYSSASYSSASYSSALSSSSSSPQERTTLAIGPEGGWIETELEAFQRVDFEIVDLGPRILRVETVLPVLIGRLF